MSDFACKSLPFSTGLVAETLMLSARSRPLYQKVAPGPLGGAACNPCYQGLTEKYVEELAEEGIVSHRSVATGSGDPGDDSEGESVHEYKEGVPLDEDLYGVCIASFLRDLRKVVSGHGNFYLRLSRLLVTVLMMFLLVALQFYLVIEMKLKVTPKEVAAMREMYDAYETHMYGNHTVITANGHTRGVAGFLDPARYTTLPSELKDSVCAIPLAHPQFFSAILLVWTLTVIADVRQLVYLMTLFACRLDTVQSVHDIFEHEEEERHGRPIRREDSTVMLLGLTRAVKASLVLCVFLPRLVLDATLLWLGSRWLMATDNLQDVFLNAVALEFILCLKDLIYAAVIPIRNKIESSELRIPQNLVERANYNAYLGAFLWLVAALSWVPFYIFFGQGVLVDYQWDIREVCNLHAM